MKRIASALVVLLVVAGCGGTGGGADKPKPADATIAKAKPATAIELANALKAEIPTITKTVQITEDNDPNDKIGRPNGYTDGAVIYDSEVEPCGSDGFGVACGASIEVWPTAKDAKLRAKTIQSILKEAGGVLGTEYDYVRGGLLLRVTGEIKPSAAKKYEAAWKSLG